ncbi:MAG: LLM class F420-dependent oxidoreductase [Micromonosporaceae bacterium]
MPPRLGRVGIWIFSGGLTPGENASEQKIAELAEVAGELEEFGYGAAWLGMADGDLSQVAWLLSRTRRIVVATGIVSIWAHSPEKTSAAYADVSAKFPDRVLLGLGVSHHHLVEAMGRRYDRPYQKMVEYLDALDRRDGAAPTVPAEGRALAALGPRMLRLAAQRSAGAHPYLVTPEHTRQAREILGDGPLLAPEQKIVLETDPSKAREIGRRSVSFYLSAPNYVANLRRLGFGEEDLAGGGSDKLIDALVAWGDANAVLTRVREHHDAGADHVALQVLTPDGSLPRAEWQLLAEVMRG